MSYSHPITAYKTKIVGDKRFGTKKPSPSKYVNVETIKPKNKGKKIISEGKSGGFY